MKDTSGNIVNNVNGLGSDGYIFEHSTANFYHNTIYGGDNILVPGNPYDTNLFGLIAKDQSVVYAYNNIITGAQFGIRNQDGSIVYADNNLLWGCKSKFHGNGTFNTGVKNLIDVDPQLVDPLNRNYHLSPTSPCIDSGDNDIGVTEDMDGDLRPMGGGSDIGSDEVM